MKNCISCGELKPLSEYYIHRKMEDGHLNKCKECTKAAVRKNRDLRINYYRAYDRDRGSRQPPEYLKEYRKANRAKYLAHNKVNNAIRDGKLTKQPCEVCGKTKVTGHHDDYAKPLDIRWLCHAHHSQWHAKHDKAKNG